MRTVKATPEMHQAFSNQLLAWKAQGTVPSEKVVAFLTAIRELMVRASVALSSDFEREATHRDIEQFLDTLDEYPDVLPHKT